MSRWGKPTKNKRIRTMASIKYRLDENEEELDVDAMDAAPGDASNWMAELEGEAMKHVAKEALPPGEKFDFDNPARELWYYFGKGDDSAVSRGGRRIEGDLEGFKDFVNVEGFDDLKNNLIAIYAVQNDKMPQEEMAEWESRVSEWWNGPGGVVYDVAKRSARKMFHLPFILDWYHDERTVMGRRSFQVLSLIYNLMQFATKLPTEMAEATNSMKNLFEGFNRFLNEGYGNVRTVDGRKFTYLGDSAGNEIYRDEKTQEKVKVSGADPERGLRTHMGQAGRDAEAGAEREKSAQWQDDVQASAKAQDRTSQQNYARERMMGLLKGEKQEGMMGGKASPGDVIRDILQSFGKDKAKAKQALQNQMKNFDDYAHGQFKTAMKGLR